VVVISIDGLRADRAHFDRNPRPTTPNLDAFLEQGVRFPNAFSQSNESLLSHAALFTGRYPSEVAWPDYMEFIVPAEAYTLAEAMQDLGYETAGFSASGHVKALFGFDQGFSVWDEAEDFASFFNTVPRALAWLQRHQAEARPFFMFLHGYDCHRPYAHDSVFYHPFDPDYQGPMETLARRRNATERIYDGVHYPDFLREALMHSGGVWMSDPYNYLRLAEAADTDTAARPLSQRDLDHMMAHYDGAVLAADTYVGLFLEALGQLGFWENTVVIVLSDHGEDLQTHGFSNHRAVLYDSTTRVPFLIGGGAIPAEWHGREDPALVDAMDLTATITDIAGAAPMGGTRGRSAWAILEGDAVPDKPASYQQGILGHTALRTESHRLVFSGFRLTDEEYGQLMAEEPIDGGHFELYHSAMDHDEQHDLVSTQVELAEQLRRDMVSWYGSLRQSQVRQPLDPEARKMLNKHGYW